MLTARGEESDRVRGLDCGADDYVVKPFSPSELVARVRAVLRPAFEAETIEYGGIAMDLAEYRATRNGDAIRLAPTEFRLLRHFMENLGHVFSREQLLDTVWGQEIYLEPRTVDVHVRRLRKSLNAGGNEAPKSDDWAAEALAEAEDTVEEDTVEYEPVSDHQEPMTAPQGPMTGSSGTEVGTRAPRPRTRASCQRRR